MAKTLEDTSRIDPQCLAGYLNFPDSFRLSREALPALRSGSGFGKPVPLPESVNVQEIDEDGVQGLLYTPAKLSKRAAVFWCHGGGYVFGSPAIHQALYVKTLELGLPVFALKYRLAPEHPFPAPLEDATHAWKWLTGPAGLKLGIDPAQVILGGTSAGGNLAAGLAIIARDDGLQRPLALVCNIPFFSAQFGLSLREPSLNKCWGSQHVAQSSEWYSPSASSNPRKLAWVQEHPSFHDLPPTQITVAELDTLRDAGIDVALRIMKESSNGCELHCWQGAFHGSVAIAPNAQVSIQHDRTILSFIERMIQ